MTPRAETRALQITLALVLVLPFTAAIAGVTVGPRFLGHPPVIPTDLDSHFRYMAGIFLAMLLLYVSCILGIERKGARLRLLAFLTVVGGCARLVSLATAGVPSLGHQVGLVIELGICPAMVLWQARVARRVEKNATRRHEEATYVATTISTFLDGSGNDCDWDDFTSCPLSDGKLDGIRRRALSIELPVDGAGEALLIQLRAEAEREASASDI